MRVAERILTINIVSSVQKNVKFAQIIGISVENAEIKKEAQYEVNKGE